MASKLYKAFSFVDNHPDLRNACFGWFYHMREKPIASYNHLIEGYNELNEADKRSARRDVNELFTDKEKNRIYPDIKVQIFNAQLKENSGKTYVTVASVNIG